MRKYQKNIIFTDVTEQKNNNIKNINSNTKTIELDYGSRGYRFESYRGHNF